MRLIEENRPNHYVKPNINNPLVRSFNATIINARIQAPRERGKRSL